MSADQAVEYGLIDEVLTQKRYGAGERPVEENDNEKEEA